MALILVQKTVYKRAVFVMADAHTRGRIQVGVPMKDAQASGTERSKKGVALSPR